MILTGINTSADRVIGPFNYAKKRALPVLCGTWRTGGRKGQFDNPSLISGKVELLECLFELGHVLLFFHLGLATVSPVDSLVESKQFG